MPLIYCVEDDDSIRDLVGYALHGQGYEIRSFSESAHFWTALKSTVPDLILLDIMLPEQDGLSLLKQVRENKEFYHIPVIMMTAKTREFDIIKGLDAGADDYVTKPFSILELLSRIRAVLRRSSVSKQEIPEILSYKTITLRPKEHIVNVGKKEVILTLKEFDLLSYLILNKGIILSRDQIMQAVWASPVMLESRTIDMHIMSIRQKLGKIGKEIRTVRGVGYRLGDKNK